jgi:hypothetical protein
VSRGLLKWQTREQKIVIAEVVSMATKKFQWEIQVWSPSQFILSTATTWLMRAGDVS